LGEGVALVVESEGGENGIKVLPRAPSADLCTAVQQDFHKAEDADVLDLGDSFAKVSIGPSLESCVEDKIIGPRPMEIKISNIFG
jgi:hypothetical protein